MAQKQYRPEEIIGKLREAEVLLSQGINVEEVCRRIEVTDLPPLFVPPGMLLNSCGYGYLGV